MDWRHLCHLIAALPLFLSPPAIAQQKAAVPTRILSLNLPISAGNPITRNVDEFRREVERRTGGALKIAIGDSARRYEDNEVISAVSSGAVEMGATSLNQFAYDVPLAGVFLQPFMFNYDALVRAAAKPGSEIRSLIDDEILYWTNTRVLSWLPRGSTVIFSRRVPDRTPTAIVNHPVGAPDDLAKELTKACGGNPHLVPTSDLYSALENDSIQVTMTDIFGVTERNLWRVADTIVNTRHSPSLFIVVINDKVWDSLSEDHQRILTQAAAALQERVWDIFAMIEADAYAFAAKKGMTVYEPSAREVVAWRECSAPLLESYVDRIGELGPKLFAAYGRLRTDPCCNNAVPDQMPADLR
ncbi:MAG: TRAP transporter substrate-binding protein DctP [Bradyrhizobiaceae bacterium]|nr:TRAP transporter substrate-binding protein DctP [Bradyrhizobiaceae bacterium]